MLEIMHPDHFDQIFSLMETSFPSDEYRTYPEQRALLEDPAYQIYHMPDPSGQKSRAFIAVWQFAGLAFIEHLAVSPACRSQGLGSCILHELDSLLSGLVCLEVELPETDLARRRIAFYERNGFFLNDYPYIQPPLSKGKALIPLLLMTYKERISSDQFNTVQRTLYREVYHTDGAWSAL